MIIFGLFVFWKLPVRELPDGIQPPVVQIQVDYKGQLSSKFILKFIDSEISKQKTKFLQQNKVNFEARLQRSSQMIPRVGANYDVFFAALNKFFEKMERHQVIFSDNTQVKTEISFVKELGSIRKFKDELCEVCDQITFY